MSQQSFESIAGDNSSALYDQDDRYFQAENYFLTASELVAGRVDAERKLRMARKNLTKQFSALVWELLKNDEMRYGTKLDLMGEYVQEADNRRNQSYDQILGTSDTPEPRYSATDIEALVRDWSRKNEDELHDAVVEQYGVDLGHDLRRLLGQTILKS